MTSEQTMLKATVITALCVLTLFVAGCGSSREMKLVAPSVVTGPYDTSEGDVLWAVVPLRNESGTALIDTTEVSDKIVAAVAQVRGVRVLPLNRTIAVMRALRMTQLGSPAEARQLATELGVDGLIIGSVTAYDPYDPPILGLALALYARPGAMNRAAASLDPRELTAQPAEYAPFPRSSYGEAPASVVSEHLDAKNHQVLMDLQQYAQGRHDPRTALGWRRYMASMDLFSEFAAWHAVSRLIDQEWVRLSRMDARDLETR